MKKLVFALVAVILLMGTQQTNAQKSQDIVDIAVSVDDFSTLVTALKAADLVGALKGDGPFTVFAPVNSGFAKIDAATLNSLLQPENKEKLSAILTYHVVSGELMASDVAAALEKGNGKAELTTLNGGKLTAMKKDDGIYLKDANGSWSKISKTDVEASNGVIHIIEDVVMPN
ncbi:MULTISPECIES: fasciclin domain-containing protein [Flavobacteriaceae]|uniref:Fasciclin domain-containing protein n=2 Tax=Flavobacteriaceae TaxID=49546 RepID=A0ABS3F0Q9_9FLAO|nr:MULTISPECIES: fasciclin domain-containing protein [Allomuricauda]MBO0331928.1 fasciclin domain-containing protein [[Muricauda] lutisoli]MBO0342703.1 fasciclin domain-containing protein [Allomuricauda profundi]MEC7769672.1 fasciclin domain-containing protein [Bacteroidota bacterium]